MQPTAPIKLKKSSFKIDARSIEEISIYFIVLHAYAALFLYTLAVTTDAVADQTDQSINQSVEPLLQPHPSRAQKRTNQTINQSIVRFIHPSINQSINQSEFSPSDSPCLEWDSKNKFSGLYWKFWTRKNVRTVLAGPGSERDGRWPSSATPAGRKCRYASPGPSWLWRRSNPRRDTCRTPPCRPCCQWDFSRISADMPVGQLMPKKSAAR